jgi:hypothetical protein
MQDTPFFFLLMQYACKILYLPNKREKIDLARLNSHFSLKTETCLTENRITHRIEATFNV